MKRYFAKIRLAWGKHHVEAGDELLNPDPRAPEQRGLAELLVRAGRVSVTDEPEEKKKTPTYKTRAIVAETPPEPPAEKPAEPVSEERPRRGRAVGAMTTENEPGLTHKVDD